MLVDSHCHLNWPSFSDDMDDVVARAKQAGVSVMQTISTSLDEFPEVLAIAERYEDVYCSVGVHPDEAGTHSPIRAEDIVALTQNPKVIGIGETGLDYYRTKEHEQAQKDFFGAHIDASRETGLPLIVHTRDADDDTVSMIREAKKKGDFPALIHCFTAGPALAEAVLEMGLYISISGIVTFKNAKELQSIVENVPLERMLVETDAPFLAPVPYRGKRNEPAYTRETAAFIAQMKGVRFEEVAEITTANFFELFSKVKRL